MLPFSFPRISLVLLSAYLSTDTCSATTIARNFHRDVQNAIPKYPYEENTTRFCAWWLDNDGSWTCPNVEEIYGVAMADFQKWNPSVTIPCTELPSNQSFCIAAYEVPTSRQISRGPLPSTAPPVSITSVVTSVSVSILVTTVTAIHTTSVYPTPTSGRNGVTTPLPYQPGMVLNCKTFYYVQPGDTCENIAAKYRISTDQLLAWNPNARADCTRLQANTYCCVGIM